MNKNALNQIVYKTDSHKKGPGIILLSGSDGGMPGSNAIPQQVITHLVDNGFTVLSLAYFGLDGLPEHLENIPLEYFEQAISTFRREVTSIALLGQSRGAELALILGSLLSNTFNAIVAVAPSSRVFGGFPHPNRPAWTYRSKAITPFIAGLKQGLEATEADDLLSLIPKQINTEDAPCIIRELFTERLARHKESYAAIEVEKIDCPLLLLSGDEDAIWPSTAFCKEIMARLDEKKSPIARRHISYQGAGHGILSFYNGPIYHPVGKFWCKLGGHKAVDEQSFQDITSFLKHPTHQNKK